MNNLICTWLDVIEHIPQFFDADTGEFEQGLVKNRILNFINLEENLIRGQLRPYYGSSLSQNSTDFRTSTLNSNSQVDFQFNTDYITASSHFTQVYKFVFSSSTEFTVYPDKGFSSVGTTDEDLELEYITIETEAWNNLTFAAGEVIFLIATHHEPILVDVVSSAAAAKVLEKTFTEETAGSSSDARILRDNVTRVINLITDPESGNILEKGKTDLDTDWIGINYDIDSLGNDNTDYTDAEIGQP